MKTILLPVIAIVLATTGISLAQTSSQPATVVTEPEAIGIVTGYNATTQLLVVAMTDTGALKTFIIANTTQLMDEAGKHAPPDYLKNGSKVTVNFTPDGDKLVATKVMIAPPVEIIAPQ